MGSYPRVTNSRWDTDPREFCIEQDLKFQEAVRTAALPDTTTAKVVRLPVKKRVGPQYAPVIARETIPKPLSWKAILFEVCNKHGLTVHELVGPQRSYPIVAARHEAMWRMTKETQMSLPQIGRRLGGRDHTTVIHGVRKHVERMAEAVK